jgi:phenylpyruvate tautomerase PptA (4-oxalocrotonate tautomerase family)
MPLVRITGTHDHATLRILGDVVHDALVATVGIPPDDRFQVLDRLPPEALIADAAYLGIARERTVFVEVTLRAGRTQEIKRAFYRRVADEALAKAGIRREDVMIVLHENAPGDWCFGAGVAQYDPG